MFGQLQYWAILVCRTVRCVDIKRLKSSVKESVTFHVKTGAQWLYVFFNVCDVRCSVVQQLHACIMSEGIP